MHLMAPDPVIGDNGNDITNACSHRFVCQRCGVERIYIDSDSDSGSEPPPLEGNGSLESLSESLAATCLQADGEVIENAWNAANSSADHDLPPPYAAPQDPQAALDAVTPGRGLPYVDATIQGGPGVIQPSDDILQQLYARAGVVPPLLPPFDPSKVGRRCYVVARGRPAYTRDTGYGLFFDWDDVKICVNGVSRGSQQSFPYEQAYLQYYRCRASGRLETAL
ncbi:hypothetical protein VKT23_017477 [Stygiomarasmius scandens]|uniref:Uncharacterized protein n=1 Tax=Marasmiellus scandens TaxID=2682957 RepID=A0ABR1IU32_9AGAR